ncbi:hypothetical protein FHS85_001876 [Rhodoligotrophos appendicifer]
MIDKRPSFTRLPTITDQKYRSPMNAKGLAKLAAQIDAALLTGTLNGYEEKALIDIQRRIVERRLLTGPQEAFVYKLLAQAGVL